MIRHWAYALEDINPVYLDEEFAAKSRFGGIVSPPVMLQSWTMPPPKINGHRRARRGAHGDRQKEPVGFIEEAGFIGPSPPTRSSRSSAILGWASPFGRRTVIEDISDEKKTALGPGHFVTWVTTYLDEQGEVLGRQRFRVLRFKPKPDGDATCAVDQPGHRVLLERAEGAQAPDPAVHRLPALRQPPRPMCPQCNSLDWDTLEASGRGTVYSYVMPQHPRFPFLEYPYIVVLVELDEGVRLVSNLCDIAPDDVGAGWRSRSSTRRSTAISCCTSSGRPLTNERHDHGLHLHRGTRGDRQGRPPAVRGPSHARAPHRARGGCVRYDPALWRELAAAGLLGIALPEAVGGSGHGSSSSRRARRSWLERGARARCTRRSCSAPTRSRARRTASSSSVPARRHRRVRLLTAGLMEPGDPTPPPGDHRASRDGTAGGSRAQGAGAGGAARRLDRGPRRDGRRRARALPGRHGRRRRRGASGGHDQLRAARRCFRLDGVRCPTRAARPARGANRSCAP